MNTLYFVKLASTELEQVVFLFTANSEAEASQLGLSGIADAYKHKYAVQEVTAICQTLDTVAQFEPC